MIANVNRILGIELLCAAQGVGFRAPLQTSARLRAVIACLRAKVTALVEDRALAPDIEAAANLIADGAVARAAWSDIAAGPPPLVLSDDSNPRPHSGNAP